MRFTPQTKIAGAQKINIIFQFKFHAHADTHANNKSTHKHTTEETHRHTGTQIQRRADTHSVLQTHAQRLTEQRVRE